MAMSPLLRGIALVLASALTACQSSRKVVPGVVAPGVSPDSAAAAQQVAGVLPDYIVGPLDQLSVHVYREADLSLDNVAVDSAGRFDMLLIGRIDAAGKTADQLSAEIQRRYERYLVDPKVSINLLSANSKRLTVEGAVARPGVFALAETTDLVSAVAQAGGPSNVARLSEVAIFRKVNGRDMVAAYDFARIRSGEAANPDVLPGDIVVVGFSGLKQGLQEFLRTVPLIAIFRPFN